MGPRAQHAEVEQ